ncbi:hypothetical protein GCM10009761_27430 [Agromyces terreus]
MMTSAIASAMPMAMIAVCLRRPASSRRRYVKNMGILGVGRSVRGSGADVDRMDRGFGGPCRDLCVAHEASAPASAPASVPAAWMPSPGDVNGALGARTRHPLKKFIGDA